MTLRQCALISPLFALLVLGSGARAQNCSMAGQWVGSYSGDSSGSVAASFTETGTSVSGTVNGYSPVTGTNSDGQVSLGYTGKHGYGSASGSFSDECSTLSGTWERIKPKSKQPIKTGTFTISQCGAPTMMFNGANIAGQTTSVVAGQEIMLTGQAPNATCVSATVSQQWSLPLENGTPTKNAVGGYTPTPTSYATASVTPLPKDTRTTSYGPFYFTSPGTYTMTYQYTFNMNGASKTSPVSTATFTTDGPTDVSLLICGGDVDEAGDADCTENGPLGKVAIVAGLLYFGGTVGNVGIAMTATATAPPGNFTWVQRITRDVVTETPTGGGAVQTCYPPEVPAPGVFPGLDTWYTYRIVNPDLTTAYDNPWYVLAGGYNKVRRAFSAKMNLMWTPTADPDCPPGGAACTIPVPLGYVKWNVDMTAKLDKSGTWVPSGNSSARDFVASSSYPTWTSWVTYVGPYVCH